VGGHRTAGLLAAVVAVAVAVAGCGGTSTGGDASLKASDVNPQPREEVKDGGVIRWAVDELPAQWNYNHLDGATQASFLVTGALLPGTFITNAEGELSVAEDYVTSAEVTSSSPRQVVTYALNRKAKWSDGTPITVKDYAAQWKALRSADSPYLVGASTGYEDVSSVEQGSSPYEVVVTFRKPFGEWQSLFNPLYPASANSSPEAFNKGWQNKIPVSAGPFKLGKIDETAKQISIVRDPSWWGAPAKLDQIVFRALAPDATVSSFANGEVDVADVGADPAGYKRALGVSGGDVREAGGPDFRHFTLNGTSPNLSDVRVRQAVTVGIDRATIAKADLTGLNWPAVTMDNHFLVNTKIGYPHNPGDLGKVDTAKAAELLDAAGWKLDGTYRKKNGKTLSLRFVLPSDVAISKQEGELVQGMLKEVGIKIVLQSVPGDAFFEDYVIPGNYDITPFSWIGTPFPVSSAVSIYEKPVKDEAGELQIQQNAARIGTAEIDRLMAKAAASLSQEQAFRYLNEADELIWQEGHSLTLYQRPQITAVKATLANVGSYGFQSIPYTDIGFQK
jgi:peptide/nickel transport system substrate-binding protein